jgi:hypothetical protein
MTNQKRRLRLLTIISAAILAPIAAFLTSCVSPVLKSKRVSLEDARPAAAAEPGFTPWDGVRAQGAGGQKTDPGPIHPSTKPIKGIAYSLPMVQVHLTAILTNVPNPTLPSKNILVTTVSNSIVENVFINRTNGSQPLIATNFTITVSTNSSLAPRVDTNASTLAYSVTVEPVISPDPSFLYALKFTHSKASSDTWGITVDPTNNFLQTVNATNADQTIQIVENLARTAATIYSLGAGAPLGGLSVNPGMVPRVAVAKPAILRPFPGRVEIFFDPTSSDDMARATSELTDIFVEKNGSTDDEAATLCPIRLSVTFNNQAVSQQTADYLKTHRPDQAKGLLYRPMLPYVLQIHNSHGERGTNLVQYLIRSPNAAPVFSLPVDRAVFVTRTTSINFNNGFLQGVNYNNPSQLSALLGLPLTVIGDIFSTVTNVLQLRFNIATGQNNIAAQQAALLNQAATINAATTNLLESVRRLQAYQAGVTNRP